MSDAPSKFPLGDLQKHNVRAELRSPLAMVAGYVAAVLFFLAVIGAILFFLI